MEIKEVPPLDSLADSLPPKAASVEAENGGQKRPPGRLIVAGIGASAGGIEALQAFFEAVPANLGVAYVVVIHLSPEHRSHLAEILAACTAMPVEQVQGSVPLAGDHIYVIPPDRRLEITDTEIGAFPFEEPRGQRAPIDLFFRSLAEQHGDGFAVILSGGGSDGAAGVKAIKERGGLILVQDPTEAAYDSMPRAAIATEVVDVILPVRELAGRLANLTQAKLRIRQTLGVEPPVGLDANGEQTLARILAHLHARTGHDFSKYKRATVLRRLSRRMQLNGKEILGDYLAFLRQNAEEVRALFDDLLISVTTFFRDPQAFEALREKVIAPLFEEGERRAGRLRVWVPGCATGEEAYSIALLLLEEAELRGVWPDLQIFASDLDTGSLATAREGRYPATIAADVSPERLRRFFVQEGDHYRVTKEVRERVLFTTHSLLRDPPFSRLDLVSCRNLLIYLDHDLQQQVFGVLYYALRPGGCLFLGVSETAEATYFRPLDKTSRLYQTRKVRGEAPSLPDLLPWSSPRLTPGEPELTRREPPLVPVFHRKLLEELAPPSILVDEQRNALHLSETAGRFLQPPGGPLSRDLIQLVRPELQGELRAALSCVFQTGETNLSSFVPVRFNGTPRLVAILAQPRRGSQDDERLALVMFLEGGEAAPAEVRPAEGEAPAAALHQLETALRRSEARMHSMNEEHEAAEEELRAANEELQSLNEEYRTTTEELETSQEELQSLNEELETVNSELENRLEEIMHAHSDLENLMAATEFGTLFLDLNLHIHRFTPRITDLFSITLNDRGRSIGDFTHRLEYDRLEDDARQVIGQLMHLEREVRSQAGRWYLARFRPYRTLDNKIAGVVVTFVDISERKQAEEEVRAASDFAEKIVESLHEALLVLTPDLRVQSANEAFYRAFQVEPGETIGRLVYELGNGQWDIPALHGLLEGVLPHNQEFNDFEVQHDFENIGPRTLLLNARRIDHVQWILLVMEDITQRKQAEVQLKELLQQKEILLKEVNHRVKNNLQAIIALLYLQAGMVGEGPMRQLLQAAQDRIKAIALIHEKLYRSDNVAHVNLADYLAGLVKQLLYSYRIDPDSLVLRLKVAETELDMDTAVPLGIMVNELVSNALKHAFPPGRMELTGQPDELEIELQVNEAGQILLTVWDNGVGLPEELDLKKTPSLGLRLVEMLTGQMRGELDIERNGGTAFKIKFSPLGR